MQYIKMQVFQSTSSARRTTGQHINGCLRPLISIHVLREEDDLKMHGQVRACLISIHVLREEDDKSPYGPSITTLKFQSTSSARRTTVKAAPMAS